MATKPLLVPLDEAVIPRNRIASGALLDYWSLTKPEINLLIAITTVVAFCMGSLVPLSRFPWVLLLHTVLGTVLVASGAGTLNQLIERRFDAQMRRTARRPLASGKIGSPHALWFGSFLSAVGIG
jgi:protoheme IX farnesyltransferase